MENRCACHNMPSNEWIDYVMGLLALSQAYGFRKPYHRPKFCELRHKRAPEAPMPAHIIDKGLPATGLLAQILINKFADHLPLYRQEAIFKREGVHVPRSSMAQWVGQCGHQQIGRASCRERVCQYV